MRTEYPRNPVRRRLLAVLTLSLSLIADSGTAATAPATPDWPLLKSYSGKVVLVDFWASWCGPCLRSFPWMNDLQQHYGGDGLVIVAVNLDQERALADTFLQKLPPKFRVEFDAAGNIARQFGVQVMPSSFLVDRHGQVRVRHAGFRDGQRAEREEQIKQLLRESP
ncbi:MAG: TlpA family protein disulfide reductase [Gammaproteobacteria bacterium]|nr:TlpA family protein disulfide reductase [Gammaproteobacteria bacterium]